MTSGFDHVQSWVFDLDHTLYPEDVSLFPQIERRMTGYLQRILNVTEREADQMRSQYWERYGTTLAGLMAEHGVDPDPFLEDVHQVDFGVLSPAPALADAIFALPGRKIIFTNGSKPYARNVLAARGLSDLFDAIYGVEDAAYRPKPEHAAFDVVFRRDGLNPKRAAMFEDTARNLLVPHEMGMRTIHVATTAQAAPYIDHHTNDLAAFLSQIA